MPEPDVVPIAPDMVVSDTLGGYDLLRRLGSGGMAEVHLARANSIEGFQKLVVLKQILPHLSRDKHFVKMFLEEARLAALLDHPNVVQVFDLGKEDDEYFFTMEFVYGENLQDLLKALRKIDQTVSIANVVTLGLGVAAGLHYAHERVGFDGRPLGIVHRDVSPTNVMITYEGGVKVADFGIAKVITRTDVTRAGTRKGKVPYMSPEQCRADKIDRRSDVFSLGIVMWEALTGQRLFEGDNEFGVMNLIVNGQIESPSKKRADVPEDLERIIMKALTVDLAKRYQSTLELQLDLETFVYDHRVRATSHELGQLMQYIFRPQPFPWGALRGSSGKGQMSPATIAEISAMTGSIGSQPSVPGTGPGTGVTRGSEVTSGVKSYASQIYGGSVPTGASMGSMGSMPSSIGSQVKPADNRARALRGIAIGLGITAAMTLVLVFGLWLGGRGAESDVKAGADEEHAEIAEADEPKAEPKTAAEPEPKTAAEPEPEAAVVPESEVEPEAGLEDAAAEEAVAAEEEFDEDELIIEDDSPGMKRRGTKRATKPKSPKKTNKKKTDLDAFMPGFGG